MKKAIYIDNTICLYNKNIISLNDFVRSFNDEKVTVIICAADRERNLQFIKMLKDVQFSGKVISCLEKRVVKMTGYHLEFTIIKDLIRVKKARGYKLVRVGGEADGGYVMLDDFTLK